MTGKTDGSVKPQRDHPSPVSVAGLQVFTFRKDIPSPQAKSPLYKRTRVSDSPSASAVDDDGHLLAFVIDETAPGKASNPPTPMAGGLAGWLDDESLFSDLAEACAFEFEDGSALSALTAPDSQRGSAFSSPALTPTHKALHDPWGSRFRGTNHFVADGSPRFRDLVLPLPPTPRFRGLVLPGHNDGIEAPLRFAPVPPSSLRTSRFQHDTDGAVAPLRALAPAPVITPMHSAGRAFFGGAPASTWSAGTVSQPRGHSACNCKKSRCLKLYCECFSASRLCRDCKCTGCENNFQFKRNRDAAVRAIRLRNPDAFKAKVSKQSGHLKGCHCKKSGCKKKYCECFQAGVVCGVNCRCNACKNTAASNQSETETKLLDICDQLDFDWVDTMSTC